MSLAGYVTMGRTVDELVEATRDHLYGTRRGQLNRLDGPVASTADTLTYTFEEGGLTPGAYIEVGDEILYVWAIDRTTKVATVERAMLGTAARNHADNALVRVAPRFYTRQIVNALRAEIASWPPDIFTVLTLDLAVSAYHTTVDLEGAYDLRDLRLLKTRRLVSQGGTYPARRVDVGGVRLSPALDFTTYPSGWALSWPNAVEAGDYEIIVGAGFDLRDFDTYSDLGEIGLAESMLDIPPIGAAVRLLFPTEIARTDDAPQGRARLAEEVPPGHASRTAQELLGWRDRRLGEESRRLLNGYGWYEG